MARALLVDRPEGDIFTHGRFKELVVGVLKDVAHGVAKGHQVGAFVRRIVAVHQHSALEGHIEGVKMLGQGAFSGLGRPDNADEFTRAYFQVYIKEDLLFKWCSYLVAVI